MLQFRNMLLIVVHLSYYRDFRGKNRDI